MTTEALGERITELTALVLALVVLVMHAGRYAVIFIRVWREEKALAERRRQEARRAREERRPVGFQTSKSQPPSPPF